MMRRRPPKGKEESEMCGRPTHTYRHISPSKIGKSPSHIVCVFMNVCLHISDIHSEFSSKNRWEFRHESLTCSKKRFCTIRKASYYPPTYKHTHTTTYTDCMVDFQTHILVLSTCLTYYMLDKREWYYNFYFLLCRMQWGKGQQFCSSERRKKGEMRFRSIRRSSLYAIVTATAMISSDSAKIAFEKKAALNRMSCSASLNFGMETNRHICVATRKAIS